MSALARRRLTGASVAAVLIVASLGAPGCYTTQMQLLKSGLDSLRTQVDEMVVRDSIAARTLDDTRRELAEQRADELALLDGVARSDRLCELNVVRQVENVANTTIVQDAWQQGQALSVHGLCYGLGDGLLRDLGVTVSA